MTYPDNGQLVGLQAWRLDGTRTDTVRRKRRGLTKISSHTPLTHSLSYSDRFTQVFSYPEYEFQAPDHGSSSCDSYYSGVMGPDYQRVLNSCIAKARLKIKSSHLNLAQSLAEYRQTASMFTEIARDVYRTFRNLRRGAPFDAIRDLVRDRHHGANKNLADRWLEYQYGVKPLIEDLYGAAQTLAEKLYGPNAGYFTVSVKEKVDTVSARNWASRTGYYKPFLPWKLSGFTHEKYQCRMEIMYRVQLSSVSRTMASIGISNPALLVWELIPYSFVADWLLPVGDWLASIDALNGVTDLRYYTVRKSFREASMSWNGNSGGICWYKDYERSNWQTNLPIPNLEYKPSKSVQAVGNGVALLVQLASKR